LPLALLADFIGSEVENDVIIFGVLGTLLGIPLNKIVIAEEMERQTR
jgi:hypothetical protein